MPGGCPQKRSEVAQGVGSYGVSFVTQHVTPGAVVRGGHIEMIEPEVGENLAKIVFAVSSVEKSLTKKGQQEFSRRSKAFFDKHVFRFFVVGLTIVFGEAFLLQHLANFVGIGIGGQKLLFVHAIGGWEYSQFLVQFLFG